MAKPVPRTKAGKQAKVKRTLDEWKAGTYGPKAAKQASFATGMLAAGRRTAAKNTRKKK